MPKIFTISGFDLMRFSRQLRCRYNGSGLLHMGQDIFTDRTSCLAYRVNSLALRLGRRRSSRFLASQ